MPRLRAPLGAALLAMAAVLAATPVQAQPSCTTVRQNLFVADALDDIYFWYDRLPDVDPARYASPEAYLDAVRYRPLDARFSYIASQASTEAFYGDSQYAGFGFSTQTTLAEDGSARMRVAQVFPDSPASDAGIRRGDDIVRIGGRTITELVAANALDGALGAGEVGVVRTLEVASADGTRREQELTKRIVTIPTVSETRVFEVSGRRVGYLFFRNFVQPSVPALDEAFTVLEEARASDLVLDLRYNGGGLVTVARQLASLIGGARTRGEVFTEFFHNDKNARRNEVLRFEERPHALGLQRVIVITTRASASASELVVNALRPFVEVVTVGDTSYGKPVGQYQVPFCGKVLFPVAFTLRNANGEGDYFDGIPPTCPAADDLDHQLGEADEGSLAEALRVVVSGGCTAAASGAAAGGRAASARPPATTFLSPQDGFRQMVNAW
jgi:carboxyl-terminal processing protease